RATSEQSIDSFVPSRHRDDVYVLPCEPGTSEGPEHVIPDSQLGGVLSRKPLASNIVDSLYGGVLTHEQPHQERRAPHHQPDIGNVRKWVLATDLQPLRSVKSQCHVDEVINAEVQLS